MNADFWLSRWEQSQIGFHQQKVNPYLVRYLGELECAPGARVFVPLSGKSLDLLWLRSQGYTAVGVELSRIAVEAFFAENNLPYTTEEVDRFTLYRTDGIEIFLGDFFALRKRHVGDLGAAYDRAALIALPPETRPAYADALAALLPGGTRTLLISIEYPADEMNGPPFTVEEEEVRRLFGGNFNVPLIETVDVLDNNPRFRERGLTALVEKIYLLERLP